MFFDDVLPMRIGARSGKTLGRWIRTRAGRAISPSTPSRAVVAGAKMPDEPTVWLPTERMAKAWVAVENGTPFEKSRLAKNRILEICSIWPWRLRIMF